ncbi:MAG: hypothetical protein CL947_03190 [Epsilonproteobacteria bacterium]|nr:hypothetical protein [Campylobacterota bacterium]
MFLHELDIKNFRCFTQKRFTFDKQFTLVTGNNGTGKTSLAEAIHYLCYMKSFRCSSIGDLVCHESDSFFLKGSFTSEVVKDISHTIQVGYAGNKKAIKLDNKAVTTYKEIFKIFQVITLLEDDINLIRGYPTARRSFIDQAALFLEPGYLDMYRSFKKIVQHRNALLSQYHIDKLELDIWTEKLWNASIVIQKYRVAVLSNIQDVINKLLKSHFNDVYEVTIQYESKHILLNEDYASFCSRLGHILAQERSMKRSLFGAHLDDFAIELKGQKARFFASRGQQKLVSLLCKLSLIKLASQNDYLPILIIDDFIADFDKIRLNQLIDLFLSCKNQVIITTPVYDSEMKKMMQKAEPDVLSMSFE